MNESIAELTRSSVRLNAEIKTKQAEIKNFEGQMKKVENLYGQKVNILESQIDDYKVYNIEKKEFLH